jgi:hypothetical protein
VDKNPMAVDLAKLSLWLTTLARDHPFTFLDHALRPGDSLVGLTRQQIIDFHWQRMAARVFGQEQIEHRIQAVTRIRQEILDGGDLVSPEKKKDKLAEADAALARVRLAGDLVVAAFFGADNDKRRKARREELLGRLTEYFKGDLAQRPTEEEAELKRGPKGINPFHWEIEFPEVFGKENPGFDAIVGNPPFMGGSKISSSSGDAYLAWLLAIHAESHGNGDLVAHFFRRAFTLVRGVGTFGLIATNTIAQGDTRSTGLRWICTHGGTIYAARRRTKWPGQAAVVVSVVHVAKTRRDREGAEISPPYDLDGRPVPLITAYLFHAGGHENPATLRAIANKSFLGSKVYGQGFIFDDTDKDGVSSPIAEMHRLIAKDPRNAERIFPYIGGEEVNDSPTHAHHRYVINFGDMTEEQARRWPDLMAIVERKVKPERMQQKREIRRRYWWRFGEPAPALYAAVRGMKRVLVNSQVSAQHAFAFLPTKLVYAHTLNVFSLCSFSALCILQCRVHETWARFFASSLEERLRYTPSDCFETFPFPDGFESDSRLEAAGKAYYEFRAALMVKNNEGLTKTYNRFHDPDEPSGEIKRLRELHTAMDRAVLDAYGWADLKPRSEFLLDYEEDEEENAGGRSRKKPYRFRWPDEFRDEVLARLLELNRRRAGLGDSPPAAAKQAKSKKAGKGGKKKSGGATLPGMEE